jgi:peptide deformylase
MQAIREAEWAGQAPPDIRISPHGTLGRAL